MSRVEFVTTVDGVEQLVRFWDASEPWAELVLVHGIGEHSGRYEATGARLAEAGISVRAFDIRGHGRTAGTRAYVKSFDHFLDDVERHLEDARRLDRPTFLLGHSLGGLICTAYGVSGRRMPDLMVLSAPALDAVTPRWQRIAAPVLGRRTPKLVIPNPIDVSQLSRDPAVGEAYIADPLVYPKSTARLGAEIFSAMDRTKRNLLHLSVRTLVIHGGEDTLVATRFSEPLGTLREVDRKVYPGLRHECFNEPEGPEVVADVVAWLREQTPSDG